MANKMHTFLITLFQSNYPLDVANRQLFITSRLLLYLQHTVFCSAEIVVKLCELSVWCSILYYIMLYHIISCHIISYHIVSYHIISYHIVSYHIISYHIVSYHIIYHISYLIVSYRVISYRIVWYIILKLRELSIWRVYIYIYVCTSIVYIYVYIDNIYRQFT
jgi:hypothetical protein